jgi:integrase
VKRRLANPAEGESSEGKFLKVGECLYRHKSSGVYYALVKNQGRQIRRSLKTNDKALAQRRLTAFRSTVANLSSDTEKRKMTFRELGDTWLEISGVHLKPSALARNQLCLRQLCTHFGQARINDVTRDMCEDWERTRGPELKASSFNKEADCLKRAFDYAVEHGYLLDNPARHIKHRKVTDKAIVIPSKEEFETLCASIGAETPRNRESVNLIRFLAYSGMRLGEATRIVWREIDWKREQFTVSGGDVGTKNRLVRVVPLFPVLKDYLLALREQRGEVRPMDTIMQVNNCIACIINACKREGLPHFTQHSLRHYFVSNAIEVGVDFKTIAAWIGHKDGGLLVAKTYGHLRTRIPTPWR